jgi:ubiquinol-cytochrome c reductase cytochrome b subunit
VYVFGVASLAALGVAIVSGFAIAIGGTDWWHTNPVGHFFNSLHLWSVELFMAFLVIHLWGKFWMAAWRGRRAMTWITGVVAPSRPASRLRAARQPRSESWLPVF